MLSQISTKNYGIQTLQNVCKLENLLDDQNAYERKNAIILSGESLPVVTDSQNCNLRVRNFIVVKLKIILQPTETDIITGHRLGKPTRQAEIHNLTIMSWRP